MKRSISKATTVAGLGISLLYSTGVAAAFIDLSSTLLYGQYGDGLAYSMPTANYEAEGDFTPQPGDPFYIPSAAGLIADLIVNAIDNNGGPSTTNIAGMDDAFETPSGNGGLNFFRTGGQTVGVSPNEINYPAPDPGGAGEFNNDFEETWDATLESMKTFLGSEEMVIFFNNVQNGSNQADNSLAIWSQGWITDENGNVVDPDGAGSETGYYEFTNNGAEYKLIAEGGGGVSGGDPTTFTSTGRRDPTVGTNTDYVLSGGELCVDTNTFQFVSCNNLGPANVIGPIPHNLGANNAAYAVIFPELNALMTTLFETPGLDLSMYTLHFDVRMGCDPRFSPDPSSDVCQGADQAVDWGKNLNGGGEKIFMATAITAFREPPVTVPEPTTLMLMALGLFGAGFARKRRTH